MTLFYSDVVKTVSSNLSQTAIDKTNIAIAEAQKVAYGHSIGMFTLYLGPF